VHRNRIERLNADGTLVTVVGKGTAGFSGDGGRATFAELDDPRLWLSASPAICSSPIETTLSSASTTSSPA